MLKQKLVETFYLKERGLKTDTDLDVGPLRLDELRDDFPQLLGVRELPAGRDLLGGDRALALSGT